MINRISSGSKDLDSWFLGYETDIVTMIAGPPGSGKTNFCILASCKQAFEGKKVIYIDTEGGFSVERVRQIVGENFERVLENILLLKPTNFDEQKKVFSNLLKTLRKEHVSLIVVDSMAMLYRIELGDARSKEEGKIGKVNKEVAKQMRILAEISRKQNIPVIITNQVYRKFVPFSELSSEPETNLVGGDLFKYWSKCIIELKREGGKRRAILLKHRSLPQREFSFVIRDKGIFKKGWI